MEHVDEQNHDQGEMQPPFHDLEAECDDWVRELRLVLQTQEHLFPLAFRFENGSQSGRTDRQSVGM